MNWLAGSQLRSDNHCPVCRACPGDPGLTIQAVSYAADTRSAWKRLSGYPAARGCLDFKPVQVARSRENGQAGAMVVADARAGRAAPLARTHGGLGCSQGTLKSPRYYIVITVHSLEPASRWQGRLTDFILCPINTDPPQQKSLDFAFFWRKNCWF